MELLVGPQETFVNSVLELPIHIGVYLPVLLVGQLSGKLLYFALRFAKLVVDVGRAPLHCLDGLLHRVVLGLELSVYLLFQARNLLNGDLGLVDPHRNLI